MWARNKLSVRERFEDEFVFEGLKIEQTLDTEPPSCVYDAAIVMAKFIEKNTVMPGKTAIELGAGCGFSTCYVARQAPDCKIISTDVESVVPLIERNIQLNELSGKAKAMPLFWGNLEHLEQVRQEAGQSIDLIYGADILFDFDCFDGLCQIFDKLNRQFVASDTQPQQQIFVGYTHRFADVERWFREGIEAKGFTVVKAEREEFAEGFIPEPFESFSILKLTRQN